MCLAIPGKVLNVEGNTAKASFEGVERDIRIDSLGEDIEEGDYILNHAGFAIEKIPPEEAEKTLELFDEIIEESSQ